MAVTDLNERFLMRVAWFLPARGDRFATRSDSETLVHFHDVLEVKCVRHRLDMFVFTSGSASNRLHSNLVSVAAERS